MAANASPPTAASPPSAPAQMMCVPLTVFRLHKTRDVDLYIWPAGDDEPTLYCSSDVALTPSDLERLTLRGHRALYVTRHAYADLSEHLHQELQSILSNGAVAIEERLSVLQTAFALEVDSAFQMINSDRAVALSKNLAQTINGLISDRAVVPHKLFDMLRHDFFTFTHVTNVASFATILAEEIGITDPAQREQITVGGLLHDLGKKFVPPAVLCKPGKLDDAEWRLVRSHPQRGYEELCERDDLTFGQLMMVYSHHEHIDGQGYPVGLVDEEIHDWAKLLAIVDVFDALTGVRPYRSPVKAHEALEFIERRAGTQFDSEMTRCWTSLMRRR